MAPTADDQPRVDEPGGTSQPEGDGPVTLAGRTEPGGQGSPDTNQGRTEPLSPTPDHPEPVAAPELSDMNVGSADPQSPSHPAAAHGPGGRPSPAAAGGGAEGGAGRPAQGRAGGTAQRAPGSLGDTPEGEAFEVDVAEGATRMSPEVDRAGRASGQGDAGPSPAAGDGALEGSSEAQPVVTGTRLPETS